MLPSIVRENLWDDLFRFPFGNLERELSLHHPQFQEAMHMKADLEEKDDAYDMKIDLPGFKKDQIKLEMENGVLHVSAERVEESEKKDKKGNIVHQERYSGSVSRSFYFGDGVKEDEIAAKFEDGVLCVTLPKKQPSLPEKKQILIGD